ncbi:HAD family hydrolase [Jannaschia formosa]|uniref:HAD family hydrolase n=1 Tax=Jannaschia formosa TaxID=2259592 RepID=UPI000E1C1F31|nr:HAD family hydrolase [Jannaschia formosa]TFL16548.1 HAD family hydrolase [Jannaschia formosa]
MKVHRLLRHLDGIRAICFDAFGTLVEITARRHPYRLLLKTLPPEARREFRRRAMREDRPTPEWPKALDADVPSEVMDEVIDAIRAEAASICLRAGVKATLTHLRTIGMPIGICSTLASPYGPPLRRALTIRPDFECFSYEVGLVKPEPAIYGMVADGLGVPGPQILFVGDTRADDVDGPRRKGMRAVQVGAVS